MKHPEECLRSSYDTIAGAYVDHLYDELTRKPLDRHLLNRFAEEVRGKGMVLDVGCGPGHVARYLHEQGVQVCGVDLSPEMIRHASRLNPQIDFSTGDMRSLDFSDGSFAGIVAFYSIIHLETDELGAALMELRRVLAEGGVLLLAFHVGDHVMHLDEMWDRAVSLDFHFLDPEKIVALLDVSGFAVTEWIEREPYEGSEHPSRRCYLLARRPEK